MPPKVIASKQAKKPKRSKKGKKVKKEEVHFETLEALMFERARDIDLENDINENFFQTATKIIQELFEKQHQVEATGFKYYTDVIRRLHGRFLEEIKENRKLVPQVKKAEEQMRLTLELASNSEICVERLKESLAEAWKEVDASHLREQDIQAKLQDIFLKCEFYEKKEEEKEEEGQIIGPLSKHKVMILRERDRITGELYEAEKRLQMQRYYSETVDYINQVQKKQVDKLEHLNRALEGEKTTLEGKLLNQYVVVADLKTINAKTLHKLETCQEQVVDTLNKLAAKKRECDRLRMLLDKNRAAKIVLNRQILHNEETIKKLEEDIVGNEEALRVLRLDNKDKSNTLSQLNKKHKKIVQDYNHAATRLYQVNRINSSLKDENTRIKNVVNSLEREVLNAASKHEELRVLKENITRDREVLRGALIKANNLVTELRHNIMTNNTTIDGLRLDINKLNVKLDETRYLMTKVEKERDEMAQEIGTLNERIEAYQDQLQLKNQQIINLTEVTEKLNLSLINFKKQFDAVHTEKMALKRNLDTVSQERDNLRDLSIKNSHQIAQSTAEINENLAAINAQKAQIERLNTDKKELISSIKNLEKTLASVRNELKEVKAKNDHLQQIISNDELKMMKIRHELEETRKQKNMIGLQLVRRNDEILLLKERMAIIQQALDNGTSQYNQRIEDIRLLKIEIANLSTDRECLRRAMSSTADMREEIIRLQRQLNQERIKIRSLHEDMKTPCGVHRWRILIGEDPQRFDLLQKIQTLQRRNVKDVTQIINLKKQLEQTQKVCDSLKHIVDQLPHDNVKDKLVRAQRINRKYEKNLKLLTAELRIHEVEVSSQKCKIEEYKESLNLQAITSARSSAEKNVKSTADENMDVKSEPDAQDLIDQPLFELSEESKTHICKESLKP